MIIFAVIVYGDPQFETSARELLDTLRQRASAVRADNLDELRSLLILAGQLEQAVEDSSSQQTDAALARKITDTVADIFYAAWASSQPELPSRNIPPSSSLQKTFTNTSGFSNRPVTVKIPEGFQFYALYPEQYCHAVLAWSRENVGSIRDRVVLIIGIRSIGTTLSALVAAALAAAGWQPVRMTARPHGHPYGRTVDLPENVRALAQHALVVDEGPGISGSSMAAVAEALSRRGFAPEEISFLPGHGKEPGAAASLEVRKWWQQIRRFVTPLEQLRWNGMTLAELLQTKSCEFAGCNASHELEDLSCGRWREKVYQTPGEWPWAAIPFEQMKFRCESGDGRSIFWKFVGFGKAGAPNAKWEWSPKPLAWFHGFVALPWEEGKPLSFADRSNPAIFQLIGRYIAAVSKAPLSGSEHKTSLKRIREMLFWNSKEALGERVAERVVKHAKKALGLHSCPAYGDGRLAPHEWLRLGNGQIVKLDALGHDADHTIIGRQPIYWDVAGAMVEWRLQSPQTLLSGLNASGIGLHPEILTFYQMAYAVFRMGQASLCAEACAHDAAESERSHSAFAAYRDYLRDLVQKAD